MSERIKKEMKRHLLAASPEIRKRHAELEQSGTSNASGNLLRQVVLGGQDGLVNVLGILLGMASGTGEAGLVILAGLAATVAESVSMAAVAYTSARAEQDHYRAMEEQERREMEELPDVETKEIELIYYKKGLRGKALASVVKQTISDKELWLRTMMREELGLYESEFVDPMREALVVGLASFAGSLIPLVPFFFLPVGPAIIGSVLLSIAVLFAGGALKARMTTGEWWKSGAEMAIIGGAAALLGYGVGLVLGAHALG